MSGIGINLRVTGHCSQGGRKYMEDTFSVAYQQTDDMKDLEYAYFGIFDGHGGPEAALYAKDHLIDAIVSQSKFWSENDDDVLRAIHDGYIQTHYAMWKDHEMWPQTATGLLSTSGTTATVAFFKKGKIYVGHVGDSCIVLGYQEKGEKIWKARPLTVDHKPETRNEINRIVGCGGKVVTKSGVPRVVWNRPRLGHRGPVRRSTPIDEIPFLAVARALGDFWSYNSVSNKFVVSPEPDVSVYPVDVETFRCLILGTDGLWNMLTPSMAVTIVQATENHNEKQVVYPPDQFVMQYNKDWINPSKVLVDKAVKRWSSAKQRADNTSVVTLLLDPPGPPKAQILLNQKQLGCSKLTGNEEHLPYLNSESFYDGHSPNFQRFTDNPSRLAIFTRYPITTTPPLQPPNVPLSSYINSLLRTKSAENPKVSIKNPDESHCDASSRDRGPIEVKEISYSDPRISIASIESSSPVSCERKRQAVNNSYNTGSKSKSRLLRNDEERNSDVENMEQWSEFRNGIPSSSSQSSVRRSRSKKRRSSEHSMDKSSTWTNNSSGSLSALDDAPLHQKQKNFPEITTTRILRSDTLANKPVRTLRSRNINLSSTFGSAPTDVISSVFAIKSRNEELRIRNMNSKSDLHHSGNPKTKCMRAALFSSASLSNQAGSAKSSVTARKSTSRRNVKR